MLCPKCDSEMEKVTFASFEVDRCTGCKGLWFDMLEHEDLKKIAGSEEIDNGDPEEGKKYNEKSDVICPKCHISMIKMVLQFLRTISANILYFVCSTGCMVYV